MGAEYVLPNDEAEQDRFIQLWTTTVGQCTTDICRMDIQYHALRLLFENIPFFAPVGDKPQRIIDFGTGTGKFVRQSLEQNWCNTNILFVRYLGDGRWCVYPRTPQQKAND